MHKILFIVVAVLIVSCNTSKPVYKQNADEITAKQLLGNPNCQAICYGGYRTQTRDVEPTLEQIREDLKILSAMKIKFLRTYNVHHTETANLLKVIKAMKKEDKKFEMYVMLGVWIDCKNAWSDAPKIRNEDSERNAVEIKEAIRLTNEYPDIVKIIAVGNESMVKWAANYHVEPSVILKWVNYLQNLKKEDKLPKNVWITSSDNFAAWGGGDASYHIKDLKELIQAVDYISLHTYPMHETHYNPVFWGILPTETQLSDKEKIDKAMLRARDYAISQYDSVSNYMKSIGVNKPIHIGETGWATLSNEHYGNEGSKATDEYKSAQFYALMREWTNKKGIACFYFEAFDENWKDDKNPLGSENHFGFINLNSEAKYALWDSVDKGVFNGLKRNGKTITKSYNGNKDALWKDVKMPKPLKN